MTRPAKTPEEIAQPSNSGADIALCTRVVIVEDDPVYRQFVRQVLKKIDGVELVGECATGQEGIDMCVRTKPQALLLDLVLPDMQGVDVIKALRQELPHLVVLLLTAHPSNDLPRELLKLGVQGFADKTATAVDLTKSIRSVLAGGLSYTSVAGIAPPTEERLISLPGHAENVKPEVLTPREREIAALVTGGKASRQHLRQAWRARRGGSHPLVHVSRAAQLSARERKSWKERPDFLSGFFVFINRAR
jgi:two-component system, NarL family, response regulator LiaR